MTLNKVRSTDAVFGGPRNIMVNGEGVREAALASVTWHCGWCSFSCPDHDRQAQRTHKCVDAAGRDLTEVKRAHARGAREAIEALKHFPIQPCVECGKTDMRPGKSHYCVRPSTSMPHDQAAAAFQRRGVSQLAADLQKETP